MRETGVSDRFEVLITLALWRRWSGAVGGLVVAVAVALATCFVIQAPGSVIGSAVMAAMLGIVAQAGDLFESAVKRQVGAKDSGHLIPGHGGLLDRLEAQGLEPLGPDWRPQPPAEAPGDAPIS